MKKQVNILGIDFMNISFNEMADELEHRIAAGEKTFVVTANPEIVMFARGNRDYTKALKAADFITPDGSGIVLASRLRGTPIKERVTGFDLTIELLKRADKKNWKVYLLGGKPDANVEAASRVMEEYPGISLVGKHHGFFDWEDSSIVESIQALEPDIVLVALGFPKQEEWISTHLNRFTKGIFIGVGGTVDILAGKAKRAPLIWRKLNLEWLYRLLKQPSRWKRMLALPMFILSVLKSPR